MKLHVVGGFLGSGKTTAIIQAARQLMQRGLRVGVVTNDQGKYLVDTAFFRLADLPAVEVTGGCFCCNYDDLDQRLDELVATADPQVVFAESVGSCADLVATVIKPLLNLQAPDGQPASFSVFCDARLLRRRLIDQPMPFSDDVVYIFDKQLEEAGLVVVNKMDLLTPDELAETLAIFGQRFPRQQALPQNALAEDGVSAWLARLEQGELPPVGPALEIDYARYGRGEAQLAWLDEQVSLTSTDGDVSTVVARVIEGFLARLRVRRAGIGHLKFILSSQAGEQKLSIPSLVEPGWRTSFPRKMGREADLLVNARVELEAAELRRLFREALDEAGGLVGESEVDYFHPRQPQPTHRMT